MRTRTRPLTSFPGCYAGVRGSGPLLALTTAAAFAASTIALKYVSKALDPSSIILLRSLVALVVLATLAAPQGTAVLKVSPRHLLPMALMGISGIVGYVYFLLLSLDHTAVSNTAIISSLSPVLTAVAAAVFIGERLSVGRYCGVLVSLSGVLLLLSQGDWNVIARVRFNYGDCLMLLAVGCSVFYGLVAKILSSQYRAITVTLYMTLAAALILLGADWHKLAAVQNISYNVWLAILFMGVVSSAFGYMLYNITVRAIGPTRTSCSVYSATPIFVMILALWMFSESITLLSILSASLISLGLYLTLHKSTKSAPDP